MATRTEAPATASWTPCRHHLMNLVFSITHAALQAAHWRTTPEVWARIKADPELKNNWQDDYQGHGALLFCLPVHLNGLTEDIELIIPTGCGPCLHGGAP